MWYYNCTSYCEDNVAKYLPSNATTSATSRRTSKEEDNEMSPQAHLEGLVTLKCGVLWH